MRASRLLAILCCLLLACRAEQGRLAAQLSSSDANALGLEIAWNSQLQLPLDGRGIASVNLWLNASKQRAYAVVRLPERMIYVAADELDASNQPIGIEEAKLSALSMAHRITGVTEGFDAQELVVPQVLLVATTRAGLVHCFDAETGRLQWATSCGVSSAPAFPAGLSSLGVVVVQGERLYLLDWDTGKQLRATKMPIATANSLGIAEATSQLGGQDASHVELRSYAFVADYTGTVKAYNLSENGRPWAYKLNGRALAVPVSLADRSRTAIATDIGWLYVFGLPQGPNIEFRYEAGSRFGGSLAAGLDAFYFGDLSGTVSKISTSDRGSVQWRFRLSQSVTSPPLVDHEHHVVFVSTEAGELAAIDDHSGYSAWSEGVYGGSRVRGPVALVNGKVICRTYSDSFLAFDVRSGRTEGETTSHPLADGMIINDLTDRLYVLGQYGQLQCLRRPHQDLPRIARPHRLQEDTDTARPTTPESESRGADRGAPPAAAATDDPFGDNPFGDPPNANQPNDAADPFGADPF